jgi:Na+-translocating ferredoxin:NAD+ oxidoreductase RnfD subunit
MTTPAAWERLARRQRRFWRSPKGYLLLMLLTLAAVAGPGEGLGRVGSTLLGAVLAATFLDILLALLVRRTWIVPDGALLSGLIVALVLSPREPWYVAPAAGAVAILSKHLLRNPWVPRVHVFNPAAAGLLAALVLFRSSESWWGALPDLPVPTLLLLLATGYLVVNHVHKFWGVLAFLGTYFALFTAAAFLTMGGTARLAEAFRVPFVNAALFFALVMLTDPPTSPNGEDDQVRFGALVAVASFAAFLLVPGLAFLPLGLLTGNAWLAWRRVQGADRLAGCPAEQGNGALRASPRVSKRRNLAQP